MSLSKKLRFEIFKRDGFQCAYCGQKPPTVVLECDHIIPVSKGGKDLVINLITACFDCNRGKTNISLDKIPQSLADSLEIIKQKEEQYREYCKYAKKIEKLSDTQIEEIAQLFEAQCQCQFSESFKKSTLKNFLRLITYTELESAIYATKEKKPYAPLRYFCGICWNKIKDKG